MAFEYFLYRTDINNTLVDRGATSFTPLPPNTGEILINFSIPTNQPLYLYRELNGNIVLNSDENIETYLSETEIINNETVVVLEDLNDYISGATTLGGNTIFVDKNGKNLRFKGLVAGNNISLTPSANTLTISSTGTGGGISEQIFTGYTATTDSRLDGIEDDIIYLSGQTANKVSNSNFNSYTASTESRFDSIEGISTGETITMYSVHADATAAITLTNQVAAAQFLANSNRNIFKLDLTNASQIKLLTRVTTASASAASPRLILRYRTAFSTVVTDYIDIGITPVQTSLSTIGLIDSGWINVTALAKAEVFLTVVQIGGDGAADPVLGLIGILVKNTVATVGFNESTFNSYTASTETRLTDIENNIIYISGQTISENIFTGYTATTNTRLNEIENDISYISGITNTKLNISDFNSYSASTILDINSRLLTTIFNTYTGVTAPNTFLQKTGGTITGSLAVAGSITEGGVSLGSKYLSITAFNTYTGSSSSVTTANNGLTKSGTNIRLGGSLTGATTITSPATGSRLSFAGFPVQYSTDVSANYNIRSHVDVGYVTGITSPINSRLTTVETNYVSGATNLGVGNGIFTTKASRNLQFKSLVAGTNVSISNDANTITINASGSGSITANNGLTLNGSNVRLGGSLTGATTITSPATGSRLSFAAFPVQYLTDISANYNSRSLVDVGYVTGITNNKIDKVFGATNKIAIFSVNGNVVSSNLPIDAITGGSSYYYYTEKTAIQTNTTTTDVTYITGTSTILAAGIWTIDFNAAAGNSSANRTVVVGFYVDNVLQGVEYSLQSNATTNVMPFVLTKDLTLTTGLHTFQIRFRQLGGGTAFVSYGAIRAILIKPN